jgi:amino acid adenylation domain-containing protein
MAKVANNKDCEFAVNTYEQHSRQCATTLALSPVSRDIDLPLSFAQQRLWFLDQLDPGSTMYNMYGAFRLTGRLDIPALERSLNEIVRRHEALRTTFRSIEGSPQQVVVARLNLTLPVIDLSGHSESDRENEARRLAAEAAGRPFDFVRGPLVRATLLRLRQEEHIFLLNIHHIVYDGWSMSVLARELAALYEAFSDGQPSPLPELPIQYADYAVWQHQWLQDEALERQLAYWKRQLTGAPAALNLPTDRRRPTVQTFRGSKQSAAITKGLSEALKALSRREGVTLFMTLLAAFKILLSRYTEQFDVVVGSPIAGRTWPQTEELIGYFANTLALRTDLSGDPTFRVLLQRVKEVALAAFSHQELPFEKVVELVQPERNVSYNPVFQVLFTFNNIPAPLLKLRELAVDPVEVDSASARFDLAFDLREQPQGLKLSAEYNTDLFDAATITRMLGHFQTLLESVVVDPDQHLSLVPLLTKAERQQMLVEWSGRAINRTPEPCLHELFEAQVTRTPDAVAVVCEGKQLTYRELNCRSNQLAHYLRKLGVKPEVLVGICIERSEEMIVGLLGILKAGGAYVPLDPTYPKSRLALMLEDIQPPVLLTEHDIERLPGREGKVICLDSEREIIARESQENLSVQMTAENLAYVIHTSGSMGRPKGVQICHCNVFRLLKATRPLFGFDEHDVWTVFHSYAFDFSVWEIWACLLQGGRLVIVPLQLAQSPAAFYDLLRTQRVTVLNQTPSAMRQLTEVKLKVSKSSDDLRLRLIICGGEAFPRDLVSPLMEWGASVWNFYGPTEATVWAAINPITSNGSESESIPIGRPIVDTRIYLLDSNLQPVPVGVPGELHIGGGGLARGYLNRPELTADKFIPDPAGNEPGARLYKTGDLARYLPDGSIDFLGRIDHQVKIRGFRIEPAEIEAVLGKHPAVREAVVIMRDDGLDAKRLVAYIVPDRQYTYTINDLRGFLKEKLPDYMVPSAFVALDVLPLTPNGKLDRRALPAPDQARPKLEETFIPPRNSTEKALVQIWAEVLRLERVGIHDNFFELGGHSLLATRILSRMRTALGLEISLRSLFQAPTIKGLADLIERLRHTEPAFPRPPLRPIPRDREMPLSFAQERLWFLHQLEPDSPAYNIPKAVRLSGALNIAALQKSLATIVSRHETLRTTFRAVDGIPRQVISKKRSIELGMIDLSEWPRSEREPELQRLIREKASLPFNLCSDLMLRATLMRLEEDEHVLLLIMHHIASDGWSIANFCREAAVLYEAFCSGRPSPLPELGIQYADFAVWERDRLQGGILEKELSYWRQQLRGAPAVLKLPTERQRTTAKTVPGAKEFFVLSAGLTQHLKALSLDGGATLFMTLLASFQILLYRYTKQHDIVVGTPIAGRNQSEVEDLIGFFVNGLLLRTDLSGNPSFRKLLERVREITLTAFIHQEMPITKVVEALRPESRLGQGSLFQVTFALQNNPMQPLELTGLTVTPLEVGTETSKVDLALVMWETTEQLYGRFEYNSDLFDAGTITRMIACFHKLLEAIVADPEQPLSLLVLATEAASDLRQTNFSTHSVAVENNEQDAAESYPLSPMQQGMVFHSEYAPESGVDIEQAIFGLHEELSVAAFERAWQRVVERHSALRTSFYSDAYGEPLQKVHRQVTLRVEEQDWRGLSAAEAEKRMEAFLKADRKRGFLLLQAPLMRLSLFRLAEADYRFVWTFHHALLDGRAFSLVLKEVFDFYEAFREGRGLDLEEPYPYRKYIDWLKGLDLSSAETFWRRALQGFTAPTPLPVQASQHRMPVPENGHAKQSTRLSADLTSALQSLARQHQLTLNTLVQAAFGILLSRYSGERDIVFGATRACRSSTVDRAESIVGVFINTLPVRINVSPEVLLLPWLKELRGRQIAVRDYEHTPLTKIQGWSDLPRGTPLFESILVFENYQYNDALRAQGDGWNNRDLLLLEQTNYSLTLSGYAGPELLLKIAYDQRRFDDETIARMLGHLEILLEGMAANPERRLVELPLLSDDERRQLLVEWNVTGRSYPTDKCIHQLFEAQVEQTPDSTAVVFNERRITYRELSEKANDLAVSLAAIGIGRGSYVPFLMDRSIEVVISMLAIMKTGAAFVPLDVHWPVERIKQILDDLNSAIILVDRAISHQPEGLGRSFILVDEERSCAVAAAKVDRYSDPADPIYAVYTSGSTGRPKAAVVAHRGITNRFLWMNEFFGSTAASAALQTTHHVYDSAVWQLFWPLINGGKTVIPLPGMETNADYLAALIERHEITITDFVPSVFNTIVPQLTNDTSVHGRLASLRTIIVGGEEITPSTTYTFMAHFPGVRVINLYGPTEASIGCICYEVTGKEDGKIPIGRPISNVHALILDPCRNLVPPGVAGELYLSGLCLGLGYLNDEEKTNAAFVENEFPEIGYSRLYKTGDLVRYLPDGNIEFLGRIDHQIKIRGFRIELGEIESVLGQHPDVGQSVVLARNDRLGDSSTPLATDKRLVAYVVAPKEKSLTSTDLRSFLRQKLPDYMVPSAFVFLDSLPLTANGKLDRNSLPAPDQDRPELRENYVAPRTPVEELLAGIWVKVLKVDKVGIHDNFFDLGGHSLLATQVISRVREAFRVDVLLRDLFEAPTVAELASRVERSTPEAGELEEIARNMAEVESLPEEEIERQLANESTSESSRTIQEGNSSHRRGSGERMNEGSAATIYQLLRAWAEDTPEAIALLSPGHKPITYRQLLIQTDSIIESLRAIGIGRNDRIIIILPNGIEMAALFLGVSCAAISVPLNPLYPKNELESYLRDIGAKALVVQAGVPSSALSVAQRHGIQVIELVSSGRDGSNLFTLKASRSVSSVPQHPLEPDNVALILHTSGTTAKPKRVLLTHRNVCASAFAVRDTLALTGGDRCLGVMPLFHIHGLIGGLLSTLAAGASFASTPIFDASCFFDWMKEFNPTWYTAVPTIHQAILGYARERSETIEPRRLRLIRSSSAPLPRKLMAQLEEVFKVPVIEAYGMTEASHQVTSNPLPPSQRKIGSVGVATGTEVAVMDEAGNVLAAEERGEIVVRGASVTAGYEPNDNNSESFRNGWFRSGDLGYFDSDGYLFLTGRLKEIINRGGEKISPFEIDEALLDHPEVLQAVAFPVPHRSLGEDVAAALVVRDPLSTTEASIREYLSGRLAPFKMPACLLMVDDIPKSSTGKIRRSALAELFAERLRGGFIAPKNDLERLVADIYADVLETEQVGAGDNFFALGGDSLRATQVISRLRSLFSIDLPIATLFSKSTVAELAQEIAVSVEALDENSKKTICEELREVSQPSSQLCAADPKGDA